jgi:hypothetical protein
MRPVTLLLCLTLAGCITTDDPAQTTAQPAPAAAAATPPASDKPAPAPTRRPAQATRGSTAPPAPPPEEEPQDPVLAIRQTCWSQGSTNKSLRTLEARADWVNKCIADKTKEQAAR